MLNTTSRMLKRMRLARRTRRIQKAIVALRLSIAPAAAITAATEADRRLAERRRTVGVYLFERRSGIDRRLVAYCHHQ